MTFRRNFVAAAVAVVALSASFGVMAQKMVLKAVDTHPAGYPTVVAVENMGKKLDFKDVGRPNHFRFQTPPDGRLMASRRRALTTA